MDENSKVVNGSSKAIADHAAVENPSSYGNSADTSGDANLNVSGSGDGMEVSGTQSNNGRSRQSSRTPFTHLSQEEADLALARTLQEQERAYMLLRMGGEGSDDGSWETGSYGDLDDSHDLEFEEIDEDDIGDGQNSVGDFDDDEEEYAFDVHASPDSNGSNAQVGELDPASFPDDEAYARALQDAEECEMAARLLAMAGISDHVHILENHENNPQDNWEEQDPDELSYEELVALGDVVGSGNRGLSADTIASLPSTSYKSKGTEDEGCDSCVICRLDYEDGEPLTLLACKHSYHSECINKWLTVNKVCPVCSSEVSTTQSS